MAERPVPERRVYRRNVHRILISLLLLIWAGLWAFLAAYVHPTVSVVAVPWLG